MGEPAPRATAFRELCLQLRHGRTLSSGRLASLRIASDANSTMPGSIPMTALPPC